jgi:tRNA pseudouridine13 synthase
LDFPLQFSRRYLPELPRTRGRIRANNANFRVDEILGFEPDGEGEHLYLQIRKNGQNTLWVKEQLARCLGVKPLDIGHAGLKDRHAITSQWLSVYLPARQPDLQEIVIDGVEVIRVQRHRQKLRPGAHQANHFSLLVTDIEAPEGLNALLEQVRNQGFPNYFGEQRFGQKGNNLEQGWQLLQKRKLRHHKKKSIYLSALRAYLFNQVLSARMENTPEQAELFDSTGPLWGRGRPDVGEAQKEFEMEVLGDWRPLCEALEFSGLKQERRPLFQSVPDLEWTWPEHDQLFVSFSLPPGCFATAMLYELMNWYEVSDRS